MKWTALLPVAIAAGLSPLLALTAFDVNSFLLRHFTITDGHVEDSIYVAQQIVANPKYESIDVVIVGGSSTREFFPSSEEASRHLSATCGKDVVVFNGSTSSQELADSVAIVDAASSRGTVPKVVVVGLTNNRLAHDWGDWSDVLAEQRVALPMAKTIFHLMPPVDALRWLLADKVNQVTRIAHLVKDGTFHLSPQVPTVQSRHIYDLLPLSDAEKRLNSLIEGAATDAPLASAPEQIAEKFNAAFDSFAGRGANILYLLTPISPQSAQVRAYQDEYVAEAISVLSTVGHVVDLRSAHGLSEAVFYDEQHLRPEGREAVWGNPSEPSNVSQQLCQLL